MNQENAPCVSVVMPTYNQGDFLQEAMDSVLQQTYGNFEFIIIDNFSTDNTERIVKNNKDTRIKYHKFMNEGIIAASRNYGIKKAQGRLIAFIDSDDMWFKDKLLSQVNDFKKDSDLGLTSGCLCIMEGVHLKKGVYRGSLAKLRYGHLYQSLIDINFICSSSVMVPSKVLHTVGLFDESPSMRCIEDYNLWLDIAMSYKIKSISDPVGIVRLHNKNTSHDDQSLDRNIHVIHIQEGRGRLTEKQSGRAMSHIYFRHGWQKLLTSSVQARSIFLCVFKLKFKDYKIVLFCIVGVLISYCPYIYRWMNKYKIDKKLGRILLNVGK